MRSRSGKGCRVNFYKTLQRVPFCTYPGCTPSELVEDTVEVVHEALIRNWARLRGWMDDNREFRVWQERLKVALQQWVESNKDDGGLLRGATLAVAEDWLQKRGEEVSKPQRWFIEKSVGLRKRERKQKERLRRRVIGGLAAGLVLALSLAGFAGWQWREVQVRETNAQLIAGSLSAEKLLASNNDLEALIKAVRTSKLLSLSNIQSDTRLFAVAALRKIVYGVRERNRLEIPRNHIKSFDFNCNMIVLGSDDGYITLLNNKGKVIKTFQGHEKSVFILRLSPNGKVIASGSGDDNIKLWDNNGKKLGTLISNQEQISSINFSRDSNTIASGSSNGNIKLWNKNGEELKHIGKHDSKVINIIISSDANIIASVDENGFIKVWNKQKQLASTISHNNLFNFSNLSFSSDAKTIATIDSGNIKIYSIQGKLTRTIKGKYTDAVNKALYSNSAIEISQTIIPKSQVVSVSAIGVGKGDYSSFSFSPDGKINISSESDGTIKFWSEDFKIIQSIKGHNGEIFIIKFNDKGDIFTSVSEQDNTIKIWNREVKQLYTFNVQRNYHLGSTSFSPDGNTIASVNNDGSIQLRNKNGTLIRTLKEHQTSSIISFSPSVISFSPDGKNIASGGLEGNLKLWDQDGRLIQNFTGHHNTITSFCFNQNGNIIASADSDGTIIFWNTNGRELHNIKGHQGSVSKIIASPDGNIIVSASLDGTIKIWSKNGKELKKLINRNGGLLSLSFSPDGNTIASGDYNGTVTLWSKNGREIQTLKGHLGTISSISFSPDSNAIISAGSDKTIKIWSKDGRELYTLEGHSSTIEELRFSLNGTTLLSSDLDGKIILWNFDLDDLLKKSCDWLQDYLKNNPNVSAEDKHLCDNIKR